MKTAIVYRSFLGTTKQYAQWLKKELGGDVFTFGQAKDDQLSKYDVVVVASGTQRGTGPERIGK